MAEEEFVELKFRLYDGSDIGPIRYAASATIAMVKDRILSEWPKDKKIIPRVANDVKLISSGKILENNKKLSECRPTFGADPPAGLLTMHVVVQPSPSKSKSEKKMVDDMKKTPVCSCTIV
ncbi:hypothetical protein LUZ60_007914 [Juncus effusus]|nr:hypothetical protein LUZ60_007914 [Juncus effusus]